jgi:NUMOD4 motif-containing protein/HNH endonuclease
MNNWSDIPNYKGYYKISDTGTVKNNKGEIMLPYKRNGYFVIELNKKGIGKKHSIHRLVGVLFVPNPDNKPYINHLNGDKLDNRKENLQWVTHLENIRHSIEVLKNHPGATGLSEKSRNHPNWGSHFKGKFDGAHAKSRKVASFTKEGVPIKEYPSISGAARELKIKSQTIDKALKGIRAFADGKVWRYCTD